MDNAEQLKQIIEWILGAGSGVAVYTVTNWVISQLEGLRKVALSPFAQRWVSYAVTILVPSVAYIVLLLIPPQTAYEWWTHLLYILGAFGVANFIHGQRDLSRVDQSTEVHNDPQ